MERDWLKQEPEKVLEDTWHCMKSICWLLGRYAHTYEECPQAPFKDTMQMAAFFKAAIELFLPPKYHTSEEEIMCKE